MTEIQNMNESFGILNLELIWNLVLGAWNFFYNDPAPLKTLLWPCKTSEMPLAPPRFVLILSLNIVYSHPRILSNE